MPTNTAAMKAAYCVAILFVLPFILVSLPSIPAWMGRAMAVSVFVFFMTVGIFWFGLSPKSKMIRESGKLNEPRFDRSRANNELMLRILVVAFGVFFFFYVTLPISLDLIHFAGGEKPTRVTGIVKYKSIPLGGLWFVHQSVRFSGDAESYSLFYSWEPLRAGGPYEFVVLRRSRLILDFHKIGE